MKRQIPILDFGRFQTDKDSFVNELGKGYEEYGFCGITNHGIPDEIIENAYSVFKQFFALNESEKNAYHIEGNGGARGYTPFGIETAKDSEHPDLKEFWHVGRELNPSDPRYTEMEKNLWVSEVPHFKEHALALYNALDQLGSSILEALALYLKLPQNYFSDKVNYGNSILRPIHYPPIKTDTKSVRAGQHEDINLITLLVGSNESGLEVLSRDGEWIPVTTIEGTIVVNIGDMLQRLTNHILPSTTHRVVNTPGESSNHPRYSIPFFLHPNSEFLIETLDTCISEENPNKYPTPITADDYLRERLIEIGLIKA
mgnify:CR=1 FL=1